MRKATFFIVLALLLVLCATPVLANGIPKLPHAFYGSVTINGGSAADGTQISATVNIGDIIATQNPVTTAGGSYGIGSLYLLVQGYDIPDGATITFYVKGVEAEGQTDTFEAGGGPTPRDLSVTIAAPAPPVGGGGVRAAPPTVDINLFGIEWSFRISDDGEILTTITATSEDGMLTITIPAGTIALDKYGNPLGSLEAAVDESPPDPPEDANIIGLAYDFGPEGATFDPAITLEYTYDPAEIPEGVAEEDLVIAYYHDGEWVECECTCDPETHCITACVCHFTCFAIITYAPAPPPPPPPAPAALSLSSLTVKPAEVEPEKAVTITVSVANTGGTEGGYTVVLKINGVKEVEKRVTVAAGSSEIVTFSVTRKDAGSYSVVVDGLSASFAVIAPPAPPPPPPPPPVVPPEVRPPVNWPLIGGIIAAVIVVGLLIFFLVRRRAY